MTRIAMSRRTVLAAGAGALAGAAVFQAAARAQAVTGLGITSEEIVRKHYKAWLKKDWAAEDALLADNFTFTSAAPDDHISKSAYKTQCWDTQVSLIERFDLERIMASGNEAFVRGVCHTKMGKSFRNVEYFRLRAEQIEAIECYFGGAGYPSAANAGKG